MSLRAKILEAGARRVKEVDGLNVYELSGADRVAVIELINELNKHGEDKTVRNHFYIKLFVIASSLINDKGEKEFDINNTTDRAELQNLKPEFIDKVFETAADLSSLEFLKGKKAKKS